MVAGLYVIQRSSGVGIKEDPDRSVIQRSSGVGIKDLLSMRNFVVSGMDRTIGSYSN